MPLSMGLFFLMAVISVLAFAVGSWIARGSVGRSWLMLAGALVLLLLWSWLVRHPAVAARALPLAVLGHLEGIAPVPLFMLILGIAWARSNLARQKCLTLFAMGLGILFFLHGGVWMIQGSPQMLPEAATEHGWIVYQSEDYSCVPAACATALNYMGVPTTEAQMAAFTHTRPRSGATLMRAAAGLSQRLEGTNIRVEVLQPRHEELAYTPMPALTPIRVEGSGRYLHMVVLLQVETRGVWLVDPMMGISYRTHDQFRGEYGGSVIAFSRDQRE